VATGIWERRRGETNEQREAFSEYLAMSPRSLRALAKRGRWCARSLTGWSAKWDWQRRAAAHDEAQAQRVADIAEKSAPTSELTGTALVIERAQKIADALSALVMQRLGHADAPPVTSDVADLSTRDLMRIAAQWADSVIRWEGTAILAAAARRGGEPEEEPFDLDVLDDEEVEQLLELRRKALRSA